MVGYPILSTLFLTAENTSVDSPGFMENVVAKKVNSLQKLHVDNGCDL